MHKKLWIVLALLVIVPGLLFTGACAKKTVKSDTEMTQTTDDQAAMEAKDLVLKAERRASKAWAKAEATRRDLVAAGGDVPTQPSIETVEIKPEPDGA